MPTNTLTASVNITCEVALENAESVIFVPNSSVSVGTDDWGSLSISFTDGIGSQEADECYAAQVSLAASANSDIDLTSFTNILGQTACTFTMVKGVVISVVSADGSKVVRAGPAAVTNGWSGWFGGNGAAALYETVYDWVAHINSWNGWTVDSTHKVYRLTNPGASTILVNVLIFGDKT